MDWYRYSDFPDTQEGLVAEFTEGLMGSLFMEISPSGLKFIELQRRYDFGRWNLEREQPVVTAQLVWDAFYASEQKRVLAEDFQFIQFDRRALQYSRQEKKTSRKHPDDSSWKRTTGVRKQWARHAHRLEFEERRRSWMCSLSSTKYKAIIEEGIQEIMENRYGHMLESGERDRHIAYRRARAEMIQWMREHNESVYKYVNAA